MLKVEKRLLFSNSFQSFNLFNPFLMTKSTPGGPGAFFISSLATSFLPTSSSFSKEPTVGFSASNVEISSKTTSSGFCLLKIFCLLAQALA